MPTQDQFVNSSAYYAAALHELGHWTGHEARLNRDIKNTFGTEPYAKEELRAELASYFLASNIGIPNKPENNASYIASWIKILKNDHNEIWRASRDAENITNYLTDREYRKSIDSKNPLVEKSTNDERKPALTDIRLMVDVKNKDVVKQVGAKWDKDLKTWYAPKDSNLGDFKSFMGNKVVALKDTKLFIPFEEKSIAKDLGAWLVLPHTLPSSFFKTNKKPPIRSGLRTVEDILQLSIFYLAKKHSFFVIFNVTFTSLKTFIIFFINFNMTLTLKYSKNIKISNYCMQARVSFICHIAVY